VIELELAGERVQSVLIDHSVRLALSGARFVVIESPFTLNSQDGDLLLSPEDDADEAFEPVRQLVGQVVNEAKVSEDGTLSVTFDSGLRLIVRPDPAYEAWNISGPDGALIVCTPGGKLAVWRAQTPHERRVVKMLEKYRDLLHDFAVGDNSAEHFETEYLARFKNDPDHVTGVEFDVLDGLFADVDAYVEDAVLREQTSGISDQELRERARAAYSRLFGEIP
jgi:hypothetical protein